MQGRHARRRKDRRCRQRRSRAQLTRLETIPRIPIRTPRQVAKTSLPGLRQKPSRLFRMNRAMIAAQEENTSHEPTRKNWADRKPSQIGLVEREVEMESVCERN